MEINEVARRLDELGITLVNYLDPEEGNKVPCIGWRDAQILLDQMDKKYLEGRNEGAYAVALTQLNQALEANNKSGWWRR